MTSLGDLDPDVRGAALKDMLRRRDRGAVPALVARLAAEDLPRLRVALVFAVGKLGDRGQLDVLEALTADPVSEVRVRAVDAVAAAGGSAADPALVRCLGRSPDAAVRDRAAHHLTKRRGADLVGLFTKMLASEKVWKRESALLALARFDSPRVVSLLVGASQDAEPVVRDAALAGLEQLAARGNRAAEASLAFCRVPDSRPDPMADLDLSLDDAAFSTTYTGATLASIDDEESPFDVPDEPPPAPARPPASRPVPAPAPPPVSAPTPAPVSVRTPAPVSVPTPAPASAPTPKPVASAPTPLDPARLSGRVPGGCHACGKRVPSGVGRCPNCNELLLAAGAPAHRVADATRAAAGLRSAPPELTAMTSALGAWAFGNLCWLLFVLALMSPRERSTFLAIPISIRVLQLGALSALQAGKQGGWWFWMMIALVGLFAGVTLVNFEALGSAVFLLLVLPRHDVRQYCGLVSDET